jgi:hypothetical protein
MYLEVPVDIHHAGLLDILEHYVPKGSKGWETVERSYNHGDDELRLTKATYARDVASLKTKFSKLVNTKKKTGNDNTSIFVHLAR